MPVPTYQEMLHPILTLAAQEPIKRSTASEAMVEHFNLSDAEAQEVLPSGSATYVQNRTGWAMTFLTKASLIEKVAKATYAATDLGHEFLRRYPNGFTEKDLHQIDGYQEAWQSSRKAKRKTYTQESEEETPDEIVDNAMTTLFAKLKSEVLAQTKTMEPLRFEKLVLDLMLKMGYGGSRENAGRLTQATGDGGVDGLINEDKLGLDVIYLQAKRYTETVVGRPKIQEFVGALAGKQANKGVFITTSTFTQGAIDFANAVQQKIILIDGEKLAALMIEHNLGVSTERTYSIKRIDSDYFEVDV